MTMTMRKAFTLLELLLVIAIMAMLGVASASGYNALTRGIKERGAIATASSILKATKERAAIDRVPTIVFCYNRVIKESSGVESPGQVVGMMTAIRRSGRLTYVRGKYLHDEFADLNLTYEPLEDESELQERAGMRLYKYDPSNSSEMEYSIVADAVYFAPDALMAYTFSDDSETNQVISSAFYNLSKSDHEPTWKVGDAYAFEFAETQLPYGYIFGNSGSIPRRAGAIEVVKVIQFDPESDTDEKIEIFTTKPDESGNPKAQKRVGEASSDDYSV